MMILSVANYQTLGSVRGKSPSRVAQNLLIVSAAFDILSVCLSLHAHRIMNIFLLLKLSGQRRKAVDNDKSSSELLQSWHGERLDAGDLQLHR